LHDVAKSPPELIATIAAEASQKVSGKTLGMKSNKWSILSLHMADHNSEMLEGRSVASECHHPALRGVEERNGC
jgi:hypothetical protein